MAMICTRSVAASSPSATRRIGRAAGRFSRGIATAPVRVLPGERRSSNPHVPRSDMAAQRISALPRSENSPAVEMMAVTSAALLACIFPFAALAKKAVEKVVEKVVAPMFENSLAGSYALMMSTSMGIEAKLQLMTAQPILAAVPVAVVLLAVFVLFIAVKANTPQTVSKSSAPPPPEANADTETPVEAMKPKEVTSDYLLSRVNTVQKHFEGSITADDFLMRLEMSLCGYGFTGENTIACVNLCRDEITNILRVKLESVFPLVFNINGLGAGLTCGVTGLKAGLSHSPKCLTQGKQRYVFFSFPHIAINSAGEVGAIARPGQSKMSCACGALIAALGQLKNEGLRANLKGPSVHNFEDPEYSILKQRIAARLDQEKKNPKDLDLVEFTKIAEHQISDDLNMLIKEGVVPEAADYAIVTGVQIHNWGETHDSEEPNFEFVYPTSMAVVIDGKRTDLDVSNMPALTPRQVRMLADMAGETTTSDSIFAYTGGSILSDVNSSDIFNAARAGKSQRLKQERFAELLQKSA